MPRTRRRARPGQFLSASRSRIFAAGFVGLSAIILILLGRMLAPFFKALVWSAVLTIMIFPVFRLLLKLFRGRRGLAAIVSTLLLAAAAVGPAVWLATRLTAETSKAYDHLRASIQAGAMKDSLTRIEALPREYLPGFVDDATLAQLEGSLGQLGASTLSGIAQDLRGWLKVILANLGLLALNLLVILLSVFYFLRDGDRWMRGLREGVPLSPQVRDLVIDRLRETTKAVVYGMFLAAVILSLVIGAGFWIFGLPLPVFFGVCSFFGALVPFIGPIVMWLPGTAWLLLGRNDIFAAILFFAYTWVAILAMDLWLRPLIIGGRAKLPVFFLLIAILGGMLSFGALGIFLGPVLVAIASAVFGIYRDLGHHPAHPLPTGRT